MERDRGLRSTRPEAAVALWAAQVFLAPYAALVRMLLAGVQHSSAALLAATVAAGAAWVFYAVVRGGSVRFGGRSIRHGTPATVALWAFGFALPFVAVALVVDGPWGYQPEGGFVASAVIAAVSVAILETWCPPPPT